MSDTTKNFSSYATIALGVSQAVTPRQAGKAFGLGDLADGNTVWLARLLGLANIGLGAAALNPATRAALRPQTVGLLGANAAVTVAAAARREIPARTALSVLAFVAALLPGALARD